MIVTTKFLIELFFERVLAVLATTAAVSLFVKRLWLRSIIVFFNLFNSSLCPLGILVVNL